uniref:Uncharacterized protein n=1 Tax=Arundo donax TaxID=35708 RepID=A0A0A9FHF0_ARUDO
MDELSFSHAKNLALHYCIAFGEVLVTMSFVMPRAPRFCIACC